MSWLCDNPFSFLYIVFFFKQKTAYEMRISDWSSDVCSSDLLGVLTRKTTDAHDALAHAVHEYQGHLQQHLEAIGDHIRAAIRKRFRAVTALQHEQLAPLRPRARRLEVVD